MTVAAPEDRALPPFPDSAGSAGPAPAAEPTVLPAGDEQLRVMVDLHPGWVCGVDEDMRYVFVNAGFCRIVGRPASEIIGRTADEVLGTSGSVARWEMLERTLAGERELSAERVHVDAQGNDRFAWVHYRCLEHGSPARRYAYSFGYDITALRQAERRVHAVTQGIGVGLWEYSLSGDAFECNDVLLQSVGCTRAELSGDLRHALRGCVQRRDRARYLRRLRGLAGMAAMTAAAGLAAGPLPAPDGEFRARHRDGHTVWFQERLHVLSRDAAGRPLRVVGVLQDISTLKAREAELERLNSDLESRIAERTQALAEAKHEAERANAAKSQFLAQMSHELRTPLNAVLGFGQLLELGTLPRVEAEYVQQIMRAGRQLLALVDESLDQAAVESGRVALQIEDVSLAAVLRECTRLLSPAAAAAEVSIELDAVPAHAVVRADRKRLRQVLLNLLTNAIKYNAARPGCVTLSAVPVPVPQPQPQPQPQLQPDAWLLHVADTGRGMDAQQLARLFEPFERLGAERLGIQGSGIGLTIARRLVGLMGGTLDAQSVPGAGSVFRVRLPAAGLKSA